MAELNIESKLYLTYLESTRISHVVILHVGSYCRSVVSSFGFRLTHGWSLHQGAARSTIYRLNRIRPDMGSVGPDDHDDDDDGHDGHDGHEGHDGHMHIQWSQKLITQSSNSGCDQHRAPRLNELAET